MSDNNVEKVEGVWFGQDVSFKRSWSDHRFTDAEVIKLLAGETITFDHVNKWGNVKSVTGSLKKYNFKGRECFGFQMDDSLSNVRPHTYRV